MCHRYREECRCYLLPIIYRVIIKMCIRDSCKVLHLSTYQYPHSCLVVVLDDNDFSPKQSLVCELPQNAYNDTIAKSVDNFLLVLIRAGQKRLILVL